jgi:hypothetical protein
MKSKNPMSDDDVRARKVKSHRQSWIDNPWDMSPAHSKASSQKRLETLKTSEAWAAFQERNRQPKPYLRGSNHPNYNHTEYEWQHTKTGVIVTATKREMQNNYGGASSNWAKVVRGAYKHTCGWALVS